MTKILWISRHPLVEAAKAELIKRYGDCEFTVISKAFSEDKVEAFHEFLDLAADYDVVGFVAPAQLQAALIEKGTVLGKKGFFVVSKMIPAKDGEQRRFEFSHIIEFNL